MLLIFIFSLLLISYAYLGYPISVWLLARFFSKPVSKGDPTKISQSVSVVISARNEELRIYQRIENILNQDYPKELLELIVVSDGSEDKTADIVEQFMVEYPDRKIKLIQFDRSQGKPSALNAGVAQTDNEFVVFTDCRQSFEPDVIRQLIANFNDPDIGCVSGELKFWLDSDSQIQAEMGVYWKYEKFVRKNESISGSVVGATGAIYAIRKNLYKPLPAETLIDDVLTPLNISEQGKRVIFDSIAVAYDVVSADAKQEWQRKVRTLAGNWQLLHLFPGVLRPSVNPLCWRFIGHKFLRLLVPFALIFLLLSSLLIDSTLSAAFAISQILFYMVIAIAHFQPALRSNVFVGIGYFFVVLNLASLFGFFLWITGKSHIAWQPAGKIKPKGVPVLMYHALEDNDHPSGYTDLGDKVYVLSVENFRNQMDYLKKEGFRTYLIEELLDFDSFPEKAVVLTFDDGHESNVTLALPILQELGFKAEFFITTGWIGTQHYMTENQLRKLAIAGMGIGSHGVTHRFLNILSEDEVRSEYTKSKELLEALLSREVHGISFPGGRIPHIKSTCFQWCCTSSVGLFCVELLTAIPRIAIKHNMPLDVFMRISQGDRTFYNKALYRSYVLGFLRRILGDRGYDTIHKMWAR